MADYFKGHGSVYLSDRDSNGNPVGGFLDFLEVSNLEINFEEERLEHMSKSNRIQSKDVSIVYSVGLKGTMTFDEHAAALLAIAFFGTNTATGGAKSATDFDDGAIADGEIHRLPGNMSHMSALTIKDSAGSPATLVLDTNYEIVGDLDSGLIKFLDVSGFTQPFTAEGTEDTGTAVGFLTNMAIEKHLVFRGINVAANDANVVMDLYKVTFSPTNLLSLLNSNTEVQTFELDFEVLKDSTKTVDATFGQYGRYRLTT